MIVMDVLELKALTMIKEEVNMSLYQIRVEDKNNNVIVLDQYKGKVLLIVNTATECFFTPQYEGLQALYNKYQKFGFEVLDFPCNQFGKEAPGTVEEILKFCGDKIETTISRFKKINVNV